MGKTDFYLAVLIVVVVIVVEVIVLLVLVVVVVVVVVNQLMACTQVSMLDTKLLSLSTLK
jgi:hypothetical protein